MTRKERSVSGTSPKVPEGRRLRAISRRLLAWLGRGGWPGRTAAACRRIRKPWRRFPASGGPRRAPSRRSPSGRTPPSSTPTRNGASPGPPPLPGPLPRPPWGGRRGDAPRGAGGEPPLARRARGALVSPPRRPDCPACPLRALCEGLREGLQEAIPAKAAKKDLPRHDVVAAWIADGKGRVLGGRRPGRGRR